MNNIKKTNLPFKTYKGCYGIQVRAKGETGWLAAQVEFKGCANDEEAIARCEKWTAGKDNGRWEARHEWRLVHNVGGQRPRIVADYP